MHPHIIEQHARLRHEELLRQAAARRRGTDLERPVGTRAAARAPGGRSLTERWRRALVAVRRGRRTAVPVAAVPPCRATSAPRCR